MIVVYASYMCKQHRRMQWTFGADDKILNPDRASSQCTTKVGCYYMEMNISQALISDWGCIELAGELRAKIEQLCLQGVGDVYSKCHEKKITDIMRKVS